MVHHVHTFSVHLQTPTGCYRQALVFPAYENGSAGIRAWGGETYYLIELVDGRCVFLRCVQHEHDAGLQDQLALLVSKHATKSLATADDWITAEKSLTRTDAQNVQLLDVTLDGTFSLPWDTFPGYVQEHFHGWQETPITDPEFLRRLRSLPSSISNKQDCNAFQRGIHLYYKPLAQWVAQHPDIRQAIEPFQKKLATRPWQALLESGYGMTCSRYNWLVERYDGRDHPRAKALLRYPLLSYHLLEHARDRSNFGRNADINLNLRVLDAIDGNRPLEEALAQCFNLPFELLDWFRTPIGLRVSHIWKRKAVGVLLLHLKSIPASCYPKTEADLAVFDQLAKCIPPTLRQKWWDCLAPIGWQALAGELSQQGILLSALTGLPDYVGKIEAYATDLVPPRKNSWAERLSLRRFKELLSCIHPYQWMHAEQRWEHVSAQALPAELEACLPCWSTPPLTSQVWPEGHVRFCRNTYDLFLAIQHMEIRFYGIHGLRRVIENYTKSCQHQHWQIVALHTQERFSSFLIIKLVKTPHGMQYEIVRHLPAHAPLDFHAGIVQADQPVPESNQRLAQHLLQALNAPEHQQALVKLYAETENLPIKPSSPTLAWLIPMIKTLPMVLRDVLAGPPSPAEFAIRVRAALRQMR